MGMGTRRSEEQQEEIWIANAELARSPGHPFYQLVNELLDGEKFDLFVEGQLYPGAAAERAAQLEGQGRPATGGVRQPAAGPGQLRQEPAATVRRVGRTELRPLLRHGWDATYASAQTRQHPQAA